MPKRKPNQNWTYFYFRQSKDVMVQEKSVIVQEEECQKYLVRHAGELPPFKQAFADIDTSGKTRFADREGGGALFELLEEGDALIVNHVDRLGRDMFDIVATCNELVCEWGIKLHTMNLLGKEMDLSSATGKFMLFGMAFAAEMYRETLAMRTRDRLAYNKTRGKLQGPFPPMGFKIVVRGKHWRQGMLVDDRYIEPDYDLLECYEAMLAMLRGGLGYWDVAREANSLGWRTPAGLTWEPRAIRRMEIQMQRIAEYGGADKLLAAGLAYGSDEIKQHGKKRRTFTYLAKMPGRKKLSSPAVRSAAS